MSYSPIIWKNVYYFSIFIYILSIIFLIFGSVWGLILLFVLIGTWSILPSFITPFLYKLEIIDFFILIIVLFYDIRIGIIFALIVYNLPFMGLLRNFDAFFPIFKDSIGIAISCLFIIPIYNYNNDILLTYVLFYIIRLFTYLIISFFVNREEIPGSIIYMILNTPVFLISGFLLLSLLGDNIEEKFSNGLYFNLELFLFGTFVIIIMISSIKYLNYIKEKNKKIKLTQEQIKYKKYIEKLKEEKPFTYLKIIFLNNLKFILRKLFKLFDRK